MKNIIRYTAIGFSMAMFGGCGTAPSKPSADMRLSVFNESMAAVHRAAMDAMATIGCDIVKNEPAYLECRRPNKIGLFVGSGGETVSVYLEEQGPKKTAVRVNTAKSFVGMMGQVNWDEQMTQEMEKHLVSSK